MVAGTASSCPDTIRFETIGSSENPHPSPLSSHDIISPEAPKSFTVKKTD